jgi:hypothetical protein
MDDFERALPSEITNMAFRSGNELVIPFNEAKQAALIAIQNLIAILGVEVFRILNNDFSVETYSGYEFKFDGNWKDFVLFNNHAALGFIGENSFGATHGYILTTTSESEFRDLPTQL